MMDDSVPKFDTSSFSNEPYSRRIEKPWGYELHWVPEDAPYMGKMIYINAGARLSLQMHDQKTESWILISGRAKVVWENNTGELIEEELRPGVGYTTKIGQKHRLIGLDNCVLAEVSTPEQGTTWRLEDDFSRPHETPEQRRADRSS